MLESAWEVLQGYLRNSQRVVHQLQRILIFDKNIWKTSLGHRFIRNLAICFILTIHNYVLAQESLGTFVVNKLYKVRARFLKQYKGMTVMIEMATGAKMEGKGTYGDM